MYKYIISFLLFLLPIITLADGIGVYSEGWRMGLLFKFGAKGYLVPSGEGQLLLGSNSSQAVVVIKDKEVRINPWAFSIPDEKSPIAKRVKALEGEYVALRYEQAHIKLPTADTDYYVKEAVTIGKPLSEKCITELDISGLKSKSSRQGRIVKASYRGTLISSYEVMIQMGDSGNNFKDMSISKDKKLYECALRYLKAGQRVKITYSESYINLSILSRETTYDIISIEPAALKGGLN